VGSGLDLPESKMRFLPILRVGKLLVISMNAIYYIYIYIYIYLVLLILLSFSVIIAQFAVSRYKSNKPEKERDRYVLRSEAMSCCKVAQSTIRVMKHLLSYYIVV
jgi:hypothetical protein